MELVRGRIVNGGDTVVDGAQVELETRTRFGGLKCWDGEVVIPTRAKLNGGPYQLLLEDGRFGTIGFQWLVPLDKDSALGHFFGVGPLQTG